MAEPYSEVELAKNGAPIHIEAHNGPLSADADGELTPEEGRRLIRAVDMRIVPILCALYALSYVRTALSYNGVSVLDLCRLSILIVLSRSTA